MHTLPYLDDIVLETVDFYENQKNLPNLDPENFKFPLILGSGNGFETGKILFRNNPALFASESEAPDKIKIPQVEEVVIISASGEKHAPILAQMAKDAGKKTFLISSKTDSSASKIADESVIFPKITEPYTYNTSTYFGYLYGAEKENYNPRDISIFFQNRVDAILKSVNFQEFDSFFMVLPNQFSLIRNMVETKFVELFGRKIARDVATYEQIKHAMTVIPHDKELFVTFGNHENKKFGQNQIDLPIFDENNYGPMMLQSYYTVGKIQKSLPNYFMENIQNYCKQSEYNISPIVKA